MIDLWNARKALRITGTVFLLLVAGQSMSGYAQDHAPEVVNTGALVPTQGLLWFFGGPPDRNELERERPAPRERSAATTSGTMCVRLCQGDEQGGRATGSDPSARKLRLIVKRAAAVSY